ncbi:cystine transport system substrate-binding protein|uniref:Amino acid ABC transporter substrate-binding protein (PAAT family) n=1 Tax=Brenneria salicis ATCC 15712 = DSM 30166 TaxID=714314 RepID=A0A366I7T7_9GAMM|nr:amino acid ABC transporter substrate-binding protein [Brenneria salicis]NMN93175.1 cystine transport system substrate-binding protein [Brenneria salicis ATCC 15712 = DSM 30166]RBP65257.1 amino acid ABC transporter substrate-binding protein (PAAT family) [Brenneria salicis ATCC 15712 = DSM 30166]RLM31750.1 amino acid ABC transporter substrate-binding protein [Brenneria salicis ATCC 15712 = DSM 30166]
MKKIGFALLTGALLATSLSTQAQDDLSAIKSAGVIKFGTEGTYAPYTYHEKSGELVGFDVEIGRAVAEKLGVRAQFIEGRWDGLIAGIDAKRYDAVINQVGVTKERQAKYDFSKPYIDSKAVLIIRGDNTAIKDFNDLKGKKAAQSLTSNYSKLATRYGANIVPTDGFNQSLDLVLSGRADATLNDNLSFLDFKKHKPDANVKIIATSPDSEPSAILIRKNQTQLADALNKALDEIKADGTYKTISVRYFGQDVSQ